MQGLAAAERERAVVELQLARARDDVGDLLGLVRTGPTTEPGVKTE